MENKPYVKGECPICGGRIMDIREECTLKAVESSDASYVNWKPQGIIKCLRCRQLIAFRIDN